MDTIQTETFICKTCGEELPIEKQSKSRKTKCKACVNEYHRKLREKRKNIEQGTPLEVVPDIPQSTEQIKENKPKKTTGKKTKNQEIKEIKQNGKMILQTMFAIASVRCGEHWAISEEESESVIDPLVNILSKYDLFNKITEQSDAVSLIVASGMIIVPRAIVSLQEYKMKKAGVKNDNSQFEDEEREVEGDNKQSRDTEKFIKPNPNSFSTDNKTNFGNAFTI